MRIETCICFLGFTFQPVWMSDDVGMSLVCVCVSLAVALQNRMGTRGKHKPLGSSVWMFSRLFVKSWVFSRT